MIMFPSFVGFEKLLYLSIENVGLWMCLDEVVCSPLQSVQQVVHLSSAFIALLKGDASPCQYGHGPSHWKPEFDIVSS